MKKILLTLVLLIGIVVGLFAQKLTYQAVIRDNNQQLVVNTAVKATVTITFTTGVPYAEEVNGSTNIHGLLSFEFGDETLAGRDWTGANIAVKVVNAATPSTVYVNDEARPVSAVPYALNVNGQSIQNYLTEHNYVDETELDSRHYLTSDSAVITTMQGNIANLTQHTTKSAIRDSVAGQIHDSISNMANVSHIHTNKDLLDTYNQTNADLADAVAKKHAHDNAAVLAATTAPYTDADSIKLKGIAEGAEVNVQADWNQSTTTADDYIKNKPTIPTVPTNVSAFSNDAGYLTNADVTTLLSAVYDKIDSLAHLVDSLSNLPHGGGGTPTVADGQPCPGTATVSDVDGNTYNTVKIGNQCWTKENLRTTTKRNSVGNIYTNNSNTGYDAETYGYYYDWAAVMQGASSTNYPTEGEKVQGICPEGWHVPSDAEWTTLTTYVSSKTEYQCDNSADNIAKALSSTTGWSSNTSDGCNAGNMGDKSNATGFSALPAGNYYNDSYTNFGRNAYFWSATEYDSIYACSRYLYYNFTDVNRPNYNKNDGRSVRCLRDASIGGGDNPSAPAMMSCEQVMECMGDTLGQLNAKIEAQGAEIETLNGTVTSQGQTIETLNSTVESQGNTIDSLAHLVDSLSNLPPGGEPTATFTCGSSKVKDVDNNEYNTVKIGSQCWMAQNLRTSTNAAGAGNIYTPTASEVPGYDVNTYGRLYDWAAVMQGASSSDAVPSGVQGICPTGWHVPSDAEWTQLTTYVKSKSEYQCDGADNIANALSAAIGWSYNTSEGCYAGSISSTINLTGFSAVPAGLYNVRSLDFSHSAFFWSTTEYDSNNAYYRNLSSNDAEVSRWDVSKDNGHSVRCLRDASIGGGDNPSEPATMSCEQVMECMGDTLGKLNAKIEAQGAEIETLNGTVTTQGNTIDSLAHVVDSLAKLVPGGDTVKFTCGTSKVKDVDNNEYNTVLIGNQCWMKENLRTKLGTDGDKGYPTSAGADSLLYGRLYTWDAMMNGSPSSNEVPSRVQGICPAGWHVPSDAEWTQLTTYVKLQPEYVCDGCSGTDDEWYTYCIAKALSQPTGWSNTGTGCNAGNTGEKSNATGFAAVPAGYCSYGNFNAFGSRAYFWSATQRVDLDAWCRSLSGNVSDVGRYYGVKDHGFSVRCLRDADNGGGDTPDTPGGDEPTATFTCGTSTVTDHEGNVYNTVQIGDQCWTRENMRCTTSPSTGTTILETSPSSRSYTGKKAYYVNGSSSNTPTYGLLYNWNAAVDTFNTEYGETSTNTEYSNAPSVSFSGHRRGICPTGWHVPSDAEWTQLTDYVSRQSQYVCGSSITYIAKALASTTGWNSYSGTCCVGDTPSNNNATGFSAVPAGGYYGIYDGFGLDAYFWFATQCDSKDAYYRYLDYSNTCVYRSSLPKYAGFSVRCLRD